MGIVPKILLADDDLTILEIYGRYFTLCGFEVKTATNGEECIELLKKETFHVAVLDIFMPPVSGLDVANYIQSEKINTDVVLLTGKASYEVAVIALRAGVKDLFEKSKSKDDKHRLLSKVKELAEMKSEGISTPSRIVVEDQLKENISETIDLIEKKLRFTIAKTLKEKYGDDYWEKVIPGRVKKKVCKRINGHIEKYPWLQRSRDESSINRWEYCDVRDYLNIIFCNWDLFQNFFLNKEYMSQHFQILNSARNSVKHNRSMDDVEIKLAEASIMWFYRSLGIFDS
jgi:DNA-binding response OmpR family regulator